MIDIEPPVGSSNTDHTIFKTPLLDHGKGKTSTSNSNFKSNVNYTRTSHDYTINYFQEENTRMSTISIKDKEPQCVVTTHRNNITMQGALLDPRSQLSIILLTNLEKHQHRSLSLSYCACLLNIEKFWTNP